MAQIFHPSMNAISRATIFGGIFLAGVVGWAVSLWFRSTYVTHADEVRDQPVPFSHDHHVAGLGISCRYCHISYEESAFAGIPSTEICIGCHSQIWRNSPLLEPVRQSYRNDEPLRWTRVHDLADFVFFNHSIHVARGVACSTCHGDVDRMPLMRKEHPMHMEWCLECHREAGRRYPSSGGQNRTVGNGAEQKLHSEDEPTANLYQIVPANETRESTTVHQLASLPSQLTDCAVCHR